MPSKATILALALAAARFTVAAPSHHEIRDMKFCSPSTDTNNCAENELCVPSGSGNDPDDVNVMVFECVKKSELTKPWPRDLDGCSVDGDCQEGEKCIGSDGMLQILNCQRVPENKPCSSTADCEENQECRADETQGISTAVLKCQDRPSVMPIESRETPVFCNEDRSCDGELVCVDKELSSSGTVKPICIPSNDACKKNSDCKGRAECAKLLVDPQPEFGTCITPPLEGQCRNDSDCDGEGSCAFTKIFPKPEFGHCVGGSIKKEKRNSDIKDCSGNKKCPENMICAAMNYLVGQGPEIWCVPSGEANA